MWWYLYVLTFILSPLLLYSSFIFAIIFLIIGIVIFLYEYYIVEGRQIGVYMGILGGLVFIDTYIILSGFGLKICINNVKKKNYGR